MIHSTCQGIDSEKALHSALTEADWAWVRSNVKAEHCSEFMKQFLAKHDTKFFELFFEKEEKWYDEEFIAYLDAVRGTTKQWKYCADNWKGANYEMLFARIACVTDVFDVPLHKWPKDALQALKKAKPEMHKFITNPKAS
jgi:hypothetical protein